MIIVPYHGIECNAYIIADRFPGNMCNSHYDSECEYVTSKADSSRNENRESLSVMSTCHIDVTCVMSTCHMDVTCVMSTCHMGITCVMPTCHIDVTCVMSTSHIDVTRVMSTWHVYMSPVWCQHIISMSPVWCYMSYRCHLCDVNMPYICHPCDVTCHIDVTYRTMAKGFKLVKYLWSTLLEIYTFKFIDRQFAITLNSGKVHKWIGTFR